MHFAKTHVNVITSPGFVKWVANKDGKGMTVLKVCGTMLPVLCVDFTSCHKKSIMFIDMFPLHFFFFSNNKQFQKRKKVVWIGN